MWGLDGGVVCGVLICWAFDYGFFEIEIEIIGQWFDDAIES